MNEMETPCKTEDDCTTPTWCRGKDRCPKLGAKNTAETPFNAAVSSRVRLRVAVTIAVAAFTASAFIVGFWISGFDFSERGATALTCYIWSLSAAIFTGTFTATHHGWND